MTRPSVKKRKGWRHFYNMMWFMHVGKPNRLKPWCVCLLHLSILNLSRNGPSHGVKRHLGGKYSKTFFSGEVHASFNRIISGPGMPLQVFIKLFFSLFGLSKYVKQKINNLNDFSSPPPATTSSTWRRTTRQAWCISSRLSSPSTCSSQPSSWSTSSLLWCQTPTKGYRSVHIPYHVMR